MAEVSAKDVAALRKMTGAGMMDCKKALQETGGDFEAAKDWLRERNLAGASKRAGRAAEQGAVEVIVDAGAGVVVELTCETDFVAKSDDFQELLSAVAEVARTEGVDALGDQSVGDTTVSDAVQQLSGKLGEKIELGRVVRFETTDGLLDGYKHIQADRGVIGVLVELDGVDPSEARAREVAHDIALHIAHAAPEYLTAEEIPADVVEKERAVLEAQTRAEGKPEAAIAKIVEGKLNGLLFKQRVLGEQPFVRDNKTTVREHVASLGAGAVIRRFARVKIGED